MKYCMASKREQTGAQQCRGMIILLKYITRNLSKNSIMGYSLHLIGSHVKFQEGPPMFLVTYNLCIY